MAQRHVTRSGKDRDGDITALCGDWGRAPKADAISDINSGRHTYYTNVGGNRAQVRVVTRNGRPYLTTAADASGRNNLDNLPDC